MKIRWWKYFLFAFIIYFLTIFFNLLIYFLIIFFEEYLPSLTQWISTIGEIILDILNRFLRPFRYVLPNLTDEEYYLLLVNSIVMTFAFAYAYLFYLIRPDMFTRNFAIQNNVYVQWLDIQRRRFEEIRRAA